MVDCDLVFGDNKWRPRSPQVARVTGENKTFLVCFGNAGRSGRASPPAACRVTSHKPAAEILLITASSSAHGRKSSNKINNWFYLTFNSVMHKHQVNVVTSQLRFLIHMYTHLDAHLQPDQFDDGSYLHVTPPVQEPAASRSLLSRPSVVLFFRSAGFPATSRVL